MKKEDYPQTEIPLIAHEGYRTQDGTIVPRMWSVNKQTQPKPVEIAALDYFNSYDWRGTHLVADLLGIVLKAQFIAAQKLGTKDFKKLARKHHSSAHFELLNSFGNFYYKEKFGDPKSCCDWLCEIDKNVFSDCLSEMFNFEYVNWRYSMTNAIKHPPGGRKGLNKTLKEIYEFPTLSEKNFCNALSNGKYTSEGVIEDIRALYTALPPEIWFMWALKQEERSDPEFGWTGVPDLLVWNFNECEFIEVKTPKDKIRPSQVDCIDRVIRPLKLKFSIGAVVPINVEDQGN